MQPGVLRARIAIGRRPEQTWRGRWAALGVRGRVDGVRPQDLRRAAQRPPGPGRHNGDAGRAAHHRQAPALVNGRRVAVNLVVVVLVLGAIDGGRRTQAFDRRFALVEAVVQGNRTDPTRAPGPLRGPDGDTGRIAMDRRLLTLRGSRGRRDVSRPGDEAECDDEQPDGAEDHPHVFDSSMEWCDDGRLPVEWRDHA